MEESVRRTVSCYRTGKNVTFIANVELSEPLTAVPTPAEATRCMFFLRWHGRVVGRVVVRPQGGEVSAASLRDAIDRARTPDMMEAWLDEWVGDDATGAGAHTPTVSVAICTRERPDDLVRALEAIAILQPAPLEVLVVDNAPVTETTLDVVRRSGFVRYVREDRRGLDAARNRALLEARGDIVAFTDDDAVPERNWLQGLLPNFNDRRVMVVTGLTLPFALDTEGQELFEEHCSFIRGFRRRVFDGQRDNPLAVGPVGAGANMAVRREAVIALGGFDERLDGGMPTRSGGDHNLFIRVLAAGSRIVYDPRAVVRHRHRASRDEVFDAVYGYGVGVYALFTGLLVERRELGVLRLAWLWFSHSQVQRLLSTDRFARALAWREIRGCLGGPRQWFRARELRGPGELACSR